MHVKVLGSRAEIEETAPYHSKKSGVLIDNRLLLDVGDASFLNRNPSVICITHLHPDHAYFVRYNENVHFSMPVYAPEPSSLANLTVVRDSFLVDSYRITPIPTIHSLKVLSQAYLIEKRNKRILYTGDMIWIEKKYHHLFGQIDLVITEASFLKKGGMVRRNKESGKIFGHNGVPDLISLFKPFTNRILLVHFGAWFYKDIKTSRKKLGDLAQINQREVIVGYDGLEFDI